MYMDPSTGQHQEMGTNSMENMLVCSTKERKPRPQPEEALKCPRCDSTNTKFCYYNNYSLSQPRYFCKSCRRYWTKGGTLRNVPVGGGCRKNRRQSSSSSRRTHDHHHHYHHHDHSITNPPAGFPSLSYDSTDLTLAFARLQKQSTNGRVGFDDNDLGNPNMLLGHPNDSIHPSASNPSFLDALRNGFVDAQNHNLYCGYGNGCIGGSDVGNNGEICVGGEMMNLHYDHHDMNTTRMKQEDNDQGHNHYSKVLFGFPWQTNGNHGIYEVDSGRESWNNHGLGNSNWQGLINSPLM